MRIGTSIVLLFVAACSLSLGQSKFGSKSFGRQIYKMSKSRNPDQLRQSIEELSARAKDKENFHQFIVLTMMLGEQYVRSGDYAKGEKALIEAYEESKKHMPTRKNKRFKLAYFTNFQFTIFDPTDRLAYYYLKIGSVHSAEKLFQESKERRDRFFAKRSIHRVHPVVGMGSLGYRKGDIESTYRQFNEAERMISHAMTSNYDYDILKRLYLNDLAEICMSLGKRDEALDYIHQLEIASSGAGKFVSKIAALTEAARILEMKARYYLQGGDYEKAKYYLDRADYYNPAKLATSDVRFKIMRTRGQLAWYQGRTSDASDRFITLVKDYRQHIAQNFIAMSDYEKEQFYASLKKDFDIFNAFVLDQKESLAAPLYEEMYNNVLNTKALLLNESNRQKNQILSSGNNELIEKLHQWEYAKALLSAEYYEPTGPQRIEQLEKQIDELEKELNTASGLFSSSTNVLTWMDVKNRLQPGEAAAEIIRVRLADKSSPNIIGDSTVYAVLLIKPDSPSPQLFTIPNGNQLEKRFLPYYRNAILSRLEDTISYREFWQPIKRELAGVRKLYLSPDGVYNQLNLNTLQNTVNRKYLIDEMELVYLTNTSDLIAKEESSRAADAVLIGRPSYDLQNHGQTGAETEGYGQRNVISEELQTFKEQEFSDLPGTEKEVSMIEPILEQHHLKVTAYLGEEAREENVKAVHGPAILHIATHGFFVDDAASAISPMIRSGIVLAGVRHSVATETQEDGILTAYEATNLDLQSTDLVVLSACQTGLGEVRNGEGVYGLQRAIVVAGAHNLIMSLWKVDDDATAELMGSFYRAWSGKNNTAEFRSAQIALRQKYQHPFFWGAFIMLGK